MRFQICEADQKLFGAPAVLEFNIRAISINDLGDLATRFGFDHDTWPDPFIGELTLEQAGVPDAKPKPPSWQIQAMVWMALRQNGLPVSWEESGQARPLLWDRLADEVEVIPRGKEPTETPASAPSAASTTRRSSTSTGTRKRKST